MGALFPLYLAGALAAAIPIYLHLRRRPPKDAVEFSSLMFLDPSKQQPLKRKSRLEHVLLLVLRCLALLLLAAMFARPFLRGDGTVETDGRHRTVVLLDTSASMRRAGLWDDAREAAARHIREVRANDALAIVAVDAAPRTLVSFADWESADASRRAEIAVNAVASIEPGWLGSDLGSGLVAAAEMLADATSDDEAAQPAEIVVISDLQSGAALDAVAEASWPAHLTVRIEPLEAKNPTNVSVAAAASLDPRRPAVRVRNDAASERTEFVLRAGETTVTAVVPPGESRVVQLEAPAAEVTIAGDGHDFDNRVYFAPREPATVTMRFIGAGEPDDSNRPEYYFRRALGASEVLIPRFVDDLAADPAILVVARPLAGAEPAAVQRFVEAGGRALVVVTSAAMDRTLATITGMGNPALEEYDGGYALLEKIEFAHPSLREFRDPRWRDFTDVHFWKYRILGGDALPDGARVVARFDTGDPAWIDLPAGKGSVFVMLSGWHPRDSQLSLSSKFVPLLFSIFADVGPQVGGVRQFFAGEPLPLDAAERKLILPSGESVALEAGESYRPAAPGIYRATGGRRERAFAVNLRPSESDLAPLAPATLGALGVPLPTGAREARIIAGEAKRRLRDRETEANQNLWRWAVVILLALLAVESWMGARAGRSLPEPQPAVP
ncbi:MAG: VWA domain-containing protein [Akkermansiaceae bacterium]|nr:VWA domain-containing protein [Akkermansiaceae bacterium]